MIFRRLFFLLFMVPAVPAWAGLLYGIETNNDELFVLDTDAGTTSVVGSLGVSWGFGGLAFDGDTLYGLDQGTSKLYTIDLQSGQASEVASVGLAAGVESFAIIDGVGYTQHVFTNALLTVDLGTGATSAIGSYSGVRVSGMTAVDGELYGIRVADPDTTEDMDLLRLDLATGAIDEIIGTHGQPNATSLAYVDGAFWTMPAITDDVWRLDPATAAATQVFNGAPYGHVTALAGKSTEVPGPMSLILLLTGMSVLGFRRYGPVSKGLRRHLRHG